MNIFDLAKEKKVLIVAHRGVCGGNIPCNSIPAFKAAVLAGADVIELDVDKTSDGELFIQHPGMEYIHLRMNDSIKGHPSAYVEKFYQHNWDLTPTQYRIPRLRDVLELLRGKCFINIDKFWENPEQIANLIRELKMEDQIIIKTADNPEFLDAVERFAPEMPFMALIRDAAAHEELKRRKLNYIGGEVLFDNENSSVASPEFIDLMHRDNKLVWVNSIVYNYKADLSAGHNDDISMSESPDLGWGWLARRGFDMIQTDFVYPCKAYLEREGLRG
ncbi:MAG: glycerophosphodiester phosphodiesterase family protein [Clostridiales bacterium]|nr:glycerophosphodiester phosphodiesterase family protein [Clostridiales bacterium]MBQ2817139.1 glycerophosphodiester phosphodiesterase family protein [Clostridia bacterium]MBQ4638605.1 glycerophosphodiester phosphodiesterase family protein [Clostridia bacterium]